MTRFATPGPGARAGGEACDLETQAAPALQRRPGPTVRTRVTELGDGGERWMVGAGLLAADNPGSDLLVLAGLDADLHTTRVVDVVTLVSGGPWTTPMFVPTLPLVTLGRIAVGALFWLAALAPRSLALMMMISPFVEFVPLGLGNVQPALSWTMTAVAMAYVTVVLLNTTNDEFDLGRQS